MVATLQLPGTSGPVRVWSLEASMTPTLVSFAFLWCYLFVCVCISAILTLCWCLQVVVPTPLPPASTMWMAADPPALGRAETHRSACTNVNLDTHPATNRTSTLVREEKGGVWTFINKREMSVKHANISSLSLHCYQYFSTSETVSNLTFELCFLLALWFSSKDVPHISLHTKEVMFSDQFVCQRDNGKSRLVKLWRDLYELFLWIWSWPANGRCWPSGLSAKKQLFVSRVKP